MAIPIDLIIGTSNEIQAIRDLISRMASSDVTTLIAGESGTGKTLVAWTIHQMSKRAGKSLLQFDCAVASEDFLEVELFGSEEAGRVKRGLLETANGRTFLLRNIDQIPLLLQPKLVRMFQDREFRRKSGSQDIPADCRFIGTCHGDIRQKIQANLFREDLYYRLNVVLINMPPLRDRREDIKPLLRALLTRLGANADRLMDKLQGQGLLDYFEKYPWPGNVKELQRVAEMVVLTERWDEIKYHMLERDAPSNRVVIERRIEFPPEYHQAGIAILSFFGEVLRKKYPDKQATVRIEQDGLRVKMMIEPFTGEPEIFEQALDQYGLVLTGRITPEEFTNDSLLVISLKHELRMAQARIEMQKELLELHGSNIGQKDRQIDKLTDLMARAFSSRQPNLVNVTVSPVITTSVNVELAVSNALGDICRDLTELARTLDKSLDVASSIEALKMELERLQASGVDEVKSSPALNKLEQLLEKASSAESVIGKAIRLAERGSALAQRLAAHYNDVAQWVGLPQIPKPFLGKE